MGAQPMDEPTLSEGEPEKVDNSNPAFRAAFIDLDETVAFMAAEMLGGTDV